MGMLIGTSIEYFFLQPSLASSMLKKRANECKNINSVVKLCFDIFRRFPFSLERAPYPLNRAGWEICPAQLIEELTDFLWIIQKRQPKRILEIGTWKGGSLFAFTKTSSPNAVIIRRIFYLATSAGVILYGGCPSTNHSILINRRYFSSEKTHMLFPL